MIDPLDDYWATQTLVLNRITAEATTVDQLIHILNQYYLPSAGDAFFPGGADCDLFDAIDEAPGWSFVWVDADYYWCAADPQGARVSFIEGDVERGNAKARPAAT